MSKTTVRLKVSNGLNNFVPVAIPFSQVEGEYLDGKTKQVDLSDGGLEAKQMMSNLAYEELIIQVLYNLDLRDKLIFVYQLLRDSGFQINHGSFAKTIHLSRCQYMRILKDVKLKTNLYILGYKNSLKKTQNKKK